MSAYRDNEDALAARIAHLEGESKHLRDRLADDETLALFVDDERLQRLNALDLTAQWKETPAERHAENTP